MTRLVVLTLFWWFALVFFLPPYPMLGVGLILMVPVVALAAHLVWGQARKPDLKFGVAAFFVIVVVPPLVLLLTDSWSR